MPSTYYSYAAATLFAGAPYPNERWMLLAAMCLGLTIPFMLVCPARLFMASRSWVWMAVCLCPTAVPFLGLMTHPDAPPATYWTTYFPLMGVILPCCRTIMRVGGGHGSLAGSGVCVQCPVILTRCVVILTVDTKYSCDLSVRHGQCTLCERIR